MSAYTTAGARKDCVLASHAPSADKGGTLSISSVHVGPRSSIVPAAKATLIMLVPQARPMHWRRRDRAARILPPRAIRFASLFFSDTEYCDRPSEFCLLLDPSNDLVLVDRRRYSQEGRHVRNH